MSPLKDHLEACVPLEIAIIERSGGISNWQFEEAQRRFAAFRETPGASESILFCDPGLTQTGISLLTECLAVLAFVPGGITAFGCHFEAKGKYRNMSHYDERINT